MDGVLVLDNLGDGVTYLLTWRGQPEPGRFDSIDAAKAYAETHSHPQSIDDDDHITWHRQPDECRSLWWGSDGYNNWTIWKA
ncbi:hypothetical protein IU443_28490 [Nocardia farcinica]|uniref:hypothetical protein n=1 Tax=Nocardia farcinica TaxID=37329 RepID=UPI001895CDF6|nr:hypothetical protein [Nocardia farcinica]MBF6393871.1 hypothetical protein [Nocardia farcinica]MBF6540770.1 hypothetical protein [Nocardia farcinica]